MTNLINREGLEFDDVLIQPIPSSVNSRTEVDISTQITPDFSLGVPIIASPMKGIVGTDLIIELGKLGGLGLLHRFHKNMDDWLKDISILEDSGVPYGLSIGLFLPSKPFEQFLKDIIFLHIHENLKVICIDVANGYTQEVLENVEALSKIIENTVGKDAIKIISGNVVTNAGVRNLYFAGAEMIRVGIGSGALCTTRNKTGVGSPQISTLLSLTNSVGHLISDGGIRNSGDIVKALASGAHSVMVGSLLAQTKESSNNGLIYGMASRMLQEQFYGDVKSIEGIEKEVEKTTTLKELIDDISWCIKSACTYVDAKNLDELRAKAQFIKTGTNSIVSK